MILLEEGYWFYEIIQMITLVLVPPLALLIIGIKKLETRPLIGKILILLAIVYTIIGIGMCSSRFK